MRKLYKFEHSYKDVLSCLELLFFLLFSSLTCIYFLLFQELHASRTSLAWSCTYTPVKDETHHLRSFQSELEVVMFSLYFCTLVWKKGILSVGMCGFMAQLVVHWCHRSHGFQSCWSRLNFSGACQFKGALSWAAHAQVCLLSSPRKILATIMDSSVSHVYSPEFLLCPPWPSPVDNILNLWIQLEKG